jgi:hypothetical protein
MLIDLRGDAELERSFAWAEADIGEIGFWHTHPSGNSKPSPPDLGIVGEGARARERPTRRRQLHRHDRHARLARIVALPAAARVHRPAWRTSWRRIRACRRVCSLGHGWWVVSPRRETTDMVAITSFWASETNLVRAGAVFAAKDPTVRRCRDFFTEATLRLTLDPEAMREAERRLWAQMTASD